MLSSASRSALRLAGTLLVAGAGGAILGVAGIPAGWLSGAMIFVAVAAVAGRPMQVPAPFARVVFVAVGISLGAAVTPQTLQGVATWPLSIVLLGVAIAGATLASAVYLRVVHGWDTLSALFGCMPGALSQVIAYAAHEKSDLRGIAVVQTIRVVFLTAGLPVALAVLGLVQGPPVRVAGRVEASVLDFALLVMACGLTALALERLRFPGGLIFGAMLASAILHAGGLVEAVLPWWFVNAGMVCLGAITGSRFANADLRLLLTHIAAALGSFAVAIAVVAAFAYGATALMALPPSDVMVAYAPGALDAMMILALALNLDPIFVGAHHVARFLLISAALPFLVRALARREPTR